MESPGWLLAWTEWLDPERVVDGWGDLARFLRLCGIVDLNVRRNQLDGCCSFARTAVGWRLCCRGQGCASRGAVTREAQKGLRFEVRRCRLSDTLHMKVLPPRKRIRKKGFLLEIPFLFLNQRLSVGI